MPLGNFTVTDVNFYVTENQNIAGVQSNALITLTPNTGYQIEAADFSFQSPVPPAINQGASYFQQNGANVELVAVFVDPTLMPSADLEIPLCVRGFDQLISITLSGTYAVTTSNATPTANGTYSASGEFNTTQTVLTKTFTATSGYYFYTLPTATVSTGELSNYAITNTTATDSNSNITSSTFVVDYTFPTANVTGDNINFVANAIEIFVGTTYINSYQVTRSPLGQFGATRSMQIYGDPGANYTLVVSPSAGADLTNVTGVIDSTGNVIIETVFPSVSADETYTYTLSGDLNPSNICAVGCSQVATFTVEQVTDMNLTFRLTSTNANVLVDSNSTYTQVLAANQTFNEISYSILISVSPQNGAVIAETTTPTTSSMTPLTAQDGATNGGTYYTITAFTPLIASITNQYTLRLTYVLSNSGSTDVINTLNLDSFITATIPPTPTGYTAGASTVFSAVCGSTGIAHTFYFTGDNIAIGVTTYTDYTLSNIFVGTGGYYRIDNSGFTQAAQINSFGEITSLSLCP